MDPDYRNSREADHIYDRLYKNRSYQSPNITSASYPRVVEQQNVPEPPPRISSDVVEVTNAGGGVGFVAVGRLVKSKSHISSRVTHRNNNNIDGILDSVNDSQLNSSKLKHHGKSERRPGKSETFTTPIRTTRSASEICKSGAMTHSGVSGRSDDNIASHSRNFSELSFSNEASDHHLVRYPNSADLSTANSGVDHRKEDDPTSEVMSQGRTHERSRRSKNVPSGRNSAKKEQSRLKTKRTRRAHEQQHSSASSQDADLATESREIVETLSKPPAATTPKCSNVVSSPLCKYCGQRHRLTENHEYDYTEEIDDDLQCDICLQPFVDPYDTKCGHTYCGICLQNYVRLKKMCPVDRKELTFSAGDCWRSSLVMRKLVNKLTVRCPNTNHCSLALPRCELEPHLKERCLGTILRCTKAMYGCSYKGPRVEQEEHIKQCDFKHLQGSPLESMYPDCSKHSVELFRPEGIAELGLAIVGGNDTPLRNVIVQNIIPGSLIAEDGRIYAGDILIEVNGEEMHNVSHVEARAILSRSAHLMRFTLLRESGVRFAVVGDNKTAADNGDNHPADEIFEQKITVTLLKPPSEQLGIKITTCEDGRAGVYILELVEGRVAHANGQLRAGDRILEISQVDLRHGTPESAARVIQNCSERVNIVVSRQRLGQPDIIANQWATDKTLPRLAAKPVQPPSPMEASPTIPPPEFFPMTSSYKEKVISVTKATHESLGIVVAGGRGGARGDLPVFVQDVQPTGVLGRDRRLMRGDLLVEVNGKQLTGLSHTEAIAELKVAAQHCKEVVLVAIELSYGAKAEDFALWEELSGVLHQRTGRTASGGTSCWASWTPSWRMWLAVPPQCRLVREMTIRRQQGGLGFSIVGGRPDAQAEKTPVFVKYVVPHGVAALQAGLKCGDEIVAINGREVATSIHTAVVHQLKSASGPLSLTIMSWPGSLH